MAERPRTILICSCEDTMPLDGAGVRRVCRDTEIIEGRQFCRAELERFRKAAASGEPITVACTQEAPLFSEIADESATASACTSEYPRAGGLVGICGQSRTKNGRSHCRKRRTWYGSSFCVAGKRRRCAALWERRTHNRSRATAEDQLDITVLIKPGVEIAPPRVTEFPIVRGDIRSAKGYLGAFEVTVDDYATASPSSRGTLEFGVPRNGAVSRCDIILDLSGGPSLFPAADFRDGYIRVDPGDPAAILRSARSPRTDSTFL